MYPFNPGCSRATCDRSQPVPHCYQHCYGQPVLGKLHYEFFHNENFKYCKPCCGIEFHQNENLKTRRPSQRSEIEAYHNNEKLNFFTKPSFSDEYPEYHQEKFKNLNHVVKEQMLYNPPGKIDFGSYCDVDNFNKNDVLVEKLSTSFQNESSPNRKIEDQFYDNLEKELCNNENQENFEKPHFDNELYHNEKMQEIGNPQLEKELFENDEKIKNLAKVHHENELYNDEKLKNQIQAIEERRKTKESLFATNLQYYSIWADKVKREITPKTSPAKETEIKNLNNPRFVRPSQSYGVSMAKDQRSFDGENQPNFVGNMFWGVKRDPNHKIVRDESRGSHGMTSEIRRRLLPENFCDQRSPRRNRLWRMRPKLEPGVFWGPMFERRRNPRACEKKNYARDKNYEAWINVLKSNNPGVVLREEKLYEEWLKSNEDRKRMMKDLKRQRNYLQRAKNPNEAFPSVFDIDNPYWPQRNAFCSDSIDEFDVYWPE